MTTTLLSFTSNGAVILLVLKTGVKRDKDCAALVHYHVSLP